MDDTFIHSTKEEHMADLMNLFKVLQKYKEEENSACGIRIPG